MINDHDPKPLFYQLRAEVESFDDGGYTVDRIGPDEYIATLPKE